MMISPESYKKQFEDASYEELIEERDVLIRFLQEYEKLEKCGDRSGPEWNIHPQPDVRYQVYMDYLAELIPFMREKYNKDAKGVCVSELHYGFIFQNDYCVDTCRYNAGLHRH